MESIRNYIGLGGGSWGDGETRRFNHSECPEFGNHRADTRQRLYITKKSFKFIWFCHNCGFSGTIYDRYQSTTGATNLRSEPTCGPTLPRNNRGKISSPSRPPRDCVGTLPAAGFRSLLKYGITLEEIKEYGISYSPRYNRLIIPVTDYDVTTTKRSIVTWQGRNLGKVTKENPKYIFAKGAKNNGGLLYSNSTCCMVEDMLSAIKVARVCSAMCLSGSHVSDNIISRLTMFDKLFLWLDLDKAGKSTHLSSRISSLLSIPCRSIITELDPKEYSTNEIKTQIQERG